MYAVTVDFGEVHYSQGCEAEGILCHDAMGGTGEAGSACIFQGAVTVSDGRFTATGCKPLRISLPSGLSCSQDASDIVANRLARLRVHTTAF